VSAPRRGRLALLLVVSALTQVVTYVVRPTATYRAIELDVPPGWLGVLAASFAIMPLVLALPSGALTDRCGERWVAVTGGLVLTSSTLVFLTAGDTVAGLVGATMLLGTGHLLCVVAQQALVANTAAPQRLDASFGHYTFAASLGQAVGPAAIVAFGGNGPIPNTDAVFLAGGLISVVLTALSMGLARVPARASRTSSDPAGSMRTLLRLPGLLGALTTSCVILAAVDITLVYLPALGAERHLSVAVIGGLLAARAAASMVSRLFLGRLTALAGRRQLLVASTVVAALGTAAVAVPMPLPVLTAVVLLMGLGLGVGQPVTMAWLAETSPPGMRGRSMSLRLLGNRAGQLVVPSAMGLVAAGLGSAGVLCGTAAALAGAAVTARNIPQPRPAQDPDAT
jgi:MFS family permease